MEFWSWYSHSERFWIVPWDCTQYLERDLAEIRPPSPLEAKEYVSPADVSGRVEAFHQIRYSMAQPSRFIPADVLPWGLTCPSTLPHSTCDMTVTCTSYFQTPLAVDTEFRTTKLTAHPWVCSQDSSGCEGWERDSSSTDAAVAVVLTAEVSNTSAYLGVLDAS